MQSSTHTAPGASRLLDLLRPSGPELEGGYRLVAPPDWAGGQAPGEGPGIRRILVPTDFSAASSGAVARAARLANQCRAALTLLHVVDINAQPQPGETAT